MIGGILILWIATLLGGFFLFAAGMALEPAAYEDWHFRTLRAFVVSGMAMVAFAMATFIIALFAVGIAVLL